MNVAFPLVLISVLLNTAAQLLLKVGMNHIGEFALSFNNLFPIGWRVVTSPFLIGGVAIYVISLATWLIVLSRIDVSAAYPLMSLGFIINAIAAYYLLSEPLNAARIAGIIFISVGTWLITRSI
ncbi:MAG: 4-amino-4-deoxy-L-arabinose transferase [Gammaproteobacteria bacterium]|nr:4-amino-4-deoxy-L-arabinose transferase [Gammaproteobacteria bacterium]